MAASALVDASTSESGIEFDVGLLVAERPSLVDSSVFAKPPALQLLPSGGSAPVSKEELAFLSRREQHIMESTRDAAQELVAQLFSLETESADAGVVAALPHPKMSLPRYRPCPTKKEETRWEKYAREKGIVKRKRSRMVWDEASEAWVPRQGFGSRANKAAKDWLIEDGADREPGSDPFEERSRDRKLKVLQNEERRLANARKNERAHEAKGLRALRGGRDGTGDVGMAGTAAVLPAGIPAQLSVAEGHVAGLTGQGRGPRARPSGEDAATKRDRLRAASASTASMGRFDRGIKGAPKAKGGRKTQGGSGRRLPSESTAGEKDRAMGVLRTMQARQDRLEAQKGAGGGGQPLPKPMRGKGSKKRRVGR